MLLKSGAACTCRHQVSLRRLERPMAIARLSRNPRQSFSGLNASQGNRVLAHIEQHLNGALPAVELATVLRLSSSHFSRAFKVRFGIPPHAYVLLRRIELAKTLMLANAGRPLADVALACGLSDQSHLARVFRRHVGETPRAWRKRQLNDSARHAGWTLGK